MTPGPEQGAEKGREGQETAEQGAENGREGQETAEQAISDRFSLSPAKLVDCNFGYFACWYP